MIASVWTQLYRWFAICLIAALVLEGVTLTALAGDDGDDDGGSTSEPWDDDDGGGGGDNDDDGVGGDDDGVGDDDCEIEIDDDGAESDGFCDDQVIVRLAAGARVNDVHRDYGTATIDTIENRRIFLLQLPAASDEDGFAQQLAGDARVTWAEPNFIDQAPEGSPRRFYLRGGDTPRSGSLDEAYAPGLIGASAARECANGAGVTVAVIDSGIDQDHPAFSTTTLRDAWNAFTGRAGPDAADDVGNGVDDDGDTLIDEMTGHGTHVAGIVTQIAPGATIMPIKALDSDGVGQAFYVARAIYHALGQNADVINLSLGSAEDTRVVNEATGDAIRGGIFIAAAAGNSGGEEPQEYPATLDGVFGVAATDSQDRRTEFTSVHVDLDLSAPGASIVSAFPADQPPLNPLGSDYALWSGTSMATPWVAGAAALVLEQNPASTPNQVTNRLRNTAAPINGSAQGMGSGRLDAGAATGCETQTQAREKSNKDKKDKKASNDKKKRKNRR